MTEISADSASPETHIELWKHYDNLRQAKNSSFLTANTIFAAVVGLTFVQDTTFIVSIALLGIVIGVAWFLLLTRNGDYIAFHRLRAGQGVRDFWTPKSWTPPSGWLDRSLPLAFVVFWVMVVVGR